MRSFDQEISGNRILNGELSSDARSSIISKSEAGGTQKELAAEFNYRRQTIADTIKRWQLYKTTEFLPQSGRPQLLNRREKRAAFQRVGLLHVSRTTVYRALKTKGLHKFRCKKRSKLTLGVAKLRLKFAKEHRKFNFRRCTIKFSDECSVERGSGRNTE
ncbi:hypothetical protein K469DRAFT_707291, partial [Zopfia rhizophila CBS 207.26]